MDPLTLAFTQVWSAATVIAAVLAGVTFGWAFVGRTGANLAYVSERLTAGTLAILTVASSLLAGVAFYIGQSVAAYIDGDAGWPRIVSRYGIWVIFSLSMGAGAYGKIKIHIFRKHEAAQMEAVKRVDRQNAITDREEH